MTKQTKVSIVIVSRKRPGELDLVLQSLRHQIFKNFEVVVVADYLPPNFANQVKFVHFDQANISAARNIGINQSTGEIIAFCDDDAIPDPTWLQRLIAPLADKRVGASGGFTRGRNGISLQWGAMRFDHSGEDTPFDLNDAKTQVFEPDTNNPVKIFGTNMVFRKSALLEVGGFDEAFHFYLDETDLKLRLDQAGWQSALVSNAQVHHKFAASDQRTADRIPTDLSEIGASKAVFCQKHMPQNINAAIDGCISQQRNRLAGKMEKSEISSLLHGLQRGIEAGKRRTSHYLTATIPPNFRRFSTANGPHILLCVSGKNQKWLDRMADELLKDGCSVSAVTLGKGIRYFQTVFHKGYWQHSGGVWGKSERSQPIIQLQSYKSRFFKERQRLQKQFPFDLVAYRTAANASKPSDVSIPLIEWSTER